MSVPVVSSADQASAGRVLGVMGIVGGVALLAAFVIDIPADQNIFRLVLYLLGAISVVVALQQRQGAMSSTVTRAVAIAAVVANASVLLREVLPYGPWHPFAGDNGLVLFYAAIAMWVTDAAFGLVILRRATVTRFGGIALAVGSVLALTGIDRLGLTSDANPTIFGPMALMGVAANGLGWILLGLDVVLRPPTARDTDAQLAGMPGVAGGAR
jgi:hypothetical protein